MLISNNHTQAQMLNPPYSNYDYIKIANPPGGSIRAAYMVGAYPTVILIKPDRVIAEQDIWPINNTILRTKVQQHGGIPQDCNALTFTLTVNAVPEEGGTVSGGGVYNAGEQVEVSATENIGWSFVNWTNTMGMIISTDATFSFTMPDNDMTINANFAMIDYELTLLVNPEESGEVTGAGTYNLGDLVEVNAIPNTGWGFVNWTDEDGTEVSDEPTYSFTMQTGDLTLIANFEPVSGIGDVNVAPLISVYPNPTKGLVRIISDSKLIGKPYVIYNHLGEIVSSGLLYSQTTEIDLSGLPVGVYYFSVANETRQSLKIIKR